MKYLLMTICTLLITNPLFAQLKKEYYENGTIKSEGMYKNDVAEGPWKFYNKEGVLQSEGNKKAGKLSGPWKIYTKEGKLNSEGRYEKSLKTGEWKVYKKTGRLHSIGKYIKGKKTGEFVYYGDNNKVEVRGTFLGDKRTGEWIFSKKPGVTIKATYKKGVLNTKETITVGKTISDFIKYSSKGKKLREGQLLNGKKTGLWTYYYEKSGDKKYTVMYKNDKREGAYIRYKYAGKMLDAKGQYKNNQKDGKWINYNLTGGLSTEANYKNGQRDGMFIVYYYLSYSEKKKYGDDRKKEVGQYKNGMKGGKWTTYYKNGKKKKEANYANGKLIGTVKTFTEVGVLTKPASSEKRRTDFTKGPSKNQAVNYKIYLLTEHSFQLKNLKNGNARVIENESISIGPLKSFTYSKLKDDMDYLFYLITETTGGKPIVKVNGAIQDKFFESKRETVRGMDVCNTAYSKKKGVAGARVSFGYSINTNAQFVLIEQVRKKK